MNISSVNREMAKRDPEREFDAPRSIAECAGLTRGEKIIALKSWRGLVQQRLDASSEGMTPGSRGENSADSKLLSEISKTLAELTDAGAAS